jgi:hypothetical protein
LVLALVLVRLSLSPFLLSCFPLSSFLFPGCWLLVRLPDA